MTTKATNADSGGIKDEENEAYLYVAVHRTEGCNASHNVCERAPQIVLNLPHLLQTHSSKGSMCYNYTGTGVPCVCVCACARARVATCGYEDTRRGYEASKFKSKACNFIVPVMQLQRTNELRTP